MAEYSGSGYRDPRASERYKELIGESRSNLLSTYEEHWLKTKKRSERETALLVDIATRSAAGPSSSSVNNSTDAATDCAARVKAVQHKYTLTQLSMICVRNGLTSNDGNHFTLHYAQGIVRNDLDLVDHSFGDDSVLPSEDDAEVQRLLKLSEKALQVDCVRLIVSYKTARVSGKRMLCRRLVTARTAKSKRTGRAASRSRAASEPSCTLNPVIPKLSVSTFIIVSIMSQQRLLVPGGVSRLWPQQPPSQQPNQPPLPCPSNVSSTCLRQSRWGLSSLPVTTNHDPKISNSKHRTCKNA
ncbi:uncharacterized protein EHS24_002633 [Apiotrichum porosum]|uniref:Uncharacterized protein n=1 Tax=Apiotrichum porosum TaxID=105984 RepID=A0A427XHH8_9TREE|nr:uncharacterized protein EHS24_002633 [Apiotrichum porosum]RSH78174.1 hypothetical protein EHS24_002633 [Apiotrichum porosum]